MLKSNQFANQLACCALVLAAATLAHAQSAAPPTKIGYIHVQAAVFSTKEGKKAGDELNAKFGAKKTELEKKQADIDQLKDQLQKGNATMSDDAKNQLMRRIDSETTALKRATEDAQADMEQEEGKIFNELSSKMYGIVVKYAKDNGYAMIFDVSQQNQPVLWAAESTNITNDMVVLYDKQYPGAAAAAKPQTPANTSHPATTPAAPAPAAGSAAPKK